MILLRRNCGLSECISVYMIAMAAADLLVMIINVMLYYIFSNHFPLSFLSFTPVCRVILCLSVVTLDLSVWFTVTFTFDRFVAICYAKVKLKYCIARTATKVVIAFSTFIVVKNNPIAFVYEAERTVNNVQWGCRTIAVFSSLRVSLPYSWFHSIMLVWLPFALIILLNSLTISRILVASRARRELRGQQSGMQSDVEVENRRKSIILLLTISSSFVLLWMTTAVSFLMTRISNTNYYRGDYMATGYIATEVGAMLKHLSSSPNTCIYAAT
ncbi:probable G-protein coupled receptor 139 [Rhincodon typus]|uniref:probable G-protein coupled receptor 139 n=1 Tax=Rhincodon typus TaxID=259920 RepID=UPI00202E7308|nr:probable G-protein coupled receptor 139 [Rhincodon typus]